MLKLNYLRQLVQLLSRANFLCHLSVLIPIYPCGSILMLRNKRLLLIRLSIAVAFVCGVIIFASYRFFESWSEYDPKEAAIEKVTQCLDAEDKEQEETCGLVTNFPCWNSIKSIVNTNNQYSVEVLWYNWEDRIPSRGGDEVYLQVTFADDNVFRILWYEGGLEHCEVESQ